MAVVLLVWSSAAAASARTPSSDPIWEVVHQQSVTTEGSSTQPGIRYAHTCAAYQGKMVCSHGYYLDWTKNAAGWRGDTWSMDMEPPFKWRMLTPGISQQTAHHAYSGGSIPPMPCGRFGHADALVNHTMYMYGGHDGGASRHGKDSFEPGYDFAELWEFDFATHRWALVKPSTDASPGARYLAAMAGVGDHLVLYGGTAPGQGDVWAFHLPTRVWRELQPEPDAKVSNHPGRRLSATLTPVEFPGGKQGVILYGGRPATGEPQGSSALAADTWFFELGTNTWRLLKPATRTQPPSRTYHAEAHTYLRSPLPPPRSGSQGGAQPAPRAVLVGLVMGGTTSTPQITCAGDAWAFTVDCAVTTIRWVQLPDMPVSLYDMRAAADNKAVYMFGGHLCERTDSHPFFYTNQVTRLDLESLLAPHLKMGCAVDAQMLLRYAPHAHGGRGSEL